MKAMVVIPDSAGGTLELRDVPEPVLQPGELLIRVRATALNRADLAMRRGAYPRLATGGDSPLTIAGLEAAGEVEYTSQRPPVESAAAPAVFVKSLPAASTRSPAPALAIAALSVTSRVAMSVRSLAPL